MAAPITLNANLNLNPSSINASAKQVQQALGRITGQASEFQKSLDASTARVFAFGATTTVIQGITQSFKKLVTTTIDVQAKLIEVNAILGASKKEFGAFRDAIFSVAKNTGQAFNTVADGAAELARQGLSAAETAKRLEAAMILTRVSGMSAEASVKALTSAINGFQSAGLSAVDITNKIIAVDTRFAVSADDLAAGFSRAGSTAEDAGVSFDQLLGLITAVEQRTARGGAVIGNAFKSIFTRLSRGSTIDDLKALGVQIDASQTGVQKLQALSNAIENIGDPTIVSQIKELAGGVYQINVVSSTLKDLASDTSIFADATKAAANAGNDAFERNSALNKSLASQINSLTVSITSFAEKIGSVTFAPLLENLVGIATTLSEFLDKALDPEKGNKFIQGIFDVIGKFISGPGLVLITGAFLKIFSMVVKFAGEGFKTVMQIGTASERIKNLESGIVDLLTKDANLRAILANQTVSQAQKEQAIIAAIKAQNALLSTQQQIVTNIANVAARGGVSGYNPNSGAFTGKKGRSFAGGYDPYAAEEKEAMSLGASSSVMAYKTYLKGFGEAIVNNQEDIVNIGGKDAVIPRYASGYPSKLAQMIAISRQARTGKFPTVQKPVGDLTAEQANAAAQRGRKVRDIYKQKRKDEKLQQQQANILDLNAAPYAYLVPNINHRETMPSVSGIIKKGKDRIPYRMSNLNIYGPRIPTGPKSLVEQGNKDQNIGRNIRRSIFENSAAFANTLNPLGGVVSAGQVAKKMNDLGGAKGAIQAAIGSAFEGAVATALNISPLKNMEGGDFDIKGQSADITKKAQTLFGTKSSTMDFKVSRSKPNIDSFAKKIYNETRTSAPKVVSRRKARGHIPRLSRGYVPNYARGTGIIGSARNALNTSKVAEKLNKISEGGDGVFGKMLVLQGALTTAGVSLGALSNSSNRTVSSLAQLASTTTQFASIGSAFGPWGAAIGALVGVLTETTSKLKDMSDSMDDQKKSEDAYVDALQNQARILKSQRVLRDVFGNGANFQAALKNIGEGGGSAKRAELYQRQSDIKNLIGMTADPVERQKLENDYKKTLEKIKAESDKYAKVLATKTQETAKLSNIENSIAKTYASMQRAIDKYATGLQQAEIINQATGNILGAVQGPMSESLSRRNAVNAEFDTTAKTYAEKLAAEQALSTNKDPAKTEELTKAAFEAGQAFKNQVAQSESILQAKRIEIANKLKEIQIKSAEQAATIINGSFDRVVRSFTEGPIDVAGIKEAGKQFNAAGTTDEAKAMILAQIGPELAKATTEAQRAMLLEIAGIKKEDITALEGRTTFAGASKAERERLMGAGQTAKDEQALVDLSTEKNALTQEMTSLQTKIKDFGTAFDAKGEITGPIKQIAAMMEKAGTDMKSFEAASVQLGNVSSQVTTLTVNTNSLLGNSIKYMEAMNNEIMILKEKIKALTNE